MVKVRIGDIALGGRVRDRAIVVQQKTKRPVQFELLDPARKTIRAWLERRGGTLNDFVFPSRTDYEPEPIETLSRPLAMIGHSLRNASIGDSREARSAG